MPSAPLLDFDLIDLSPILHDHAAIYSRLQQANRFALLDAVHHWDPENALIVGSKEIRADDWWAADHIPGRPLFPGVLMVEAAAQLCTFDYTLRFPDRTDFVGFGGLDETRFRGVVEPGRRMTFVAHGLRFRSRMFLYSTQGFLGRDLVFETQVIGVVV